MILNTIQDRRWNMVGHVLRHEKELLNIKIAEKRMEKKIEDDQEDLT